jgi:hypothetical protein
MCAIGIRRHKMLQHTLSANGPEPSTGRVGSSSAIAAKRTIASYEYRPSRRLSKTDGLKGRNV